MAKLFLGGVSPNTQKEDLEAHFGQYGTITDSVVMFKDGRHRGFGFVTFAEDEAADAVLAEPQVIHERVIDVKRAVPGNEAPPPKYISGAGGGGFAGGGGGFAGGVFNGDGGGCGFGGGCGGGGYKGGCGGCCGGGGFGGGGFKGGGGKGGGKGGKGGPSGGHQGPTDKVFIGGLSPMTTDETLNAYFGRYGTLVDVVVMKDRVTQKSRGFGFVRYDNTDSVEQVMADYDNHEIDGKWIEAKKAVPQDMMAPPQSKGPPKGCYGGGKLGGYGLAQFPQMGGYAPLNYGAFGGGYGGGGGMGGKGGYRKGPY